MRAETGLSPDAPIVVIGAGQAGFSAANRLRDLGHAGPITLVGAESEAPYQRPPLSKAYLLGDMSRDRLFLRPADYYANRNLTLRLGQTATQILPGEHKVSLSDGSNLTYQRLLLATGASPRRLPSEIGGNLEDVLVMRSLADADAMSRTLQPGRHLLVVGGGYIGLEAAASAVKLGLKVTLIEAADRILQRVAAPETSDYFRKLHLSHGVDLREGTGLSHLMGQNGKVAGAVLADGTLLSVDAVVVGIGVQPETALAEAAGLAVDNGIRVDEFCQTSAPGIYAAGDCASFPWRGQRIRLESVGNAIDQAEAAAANMLGQASAYQAKPWFWSDQFDVKLQIAGLSRDYDRVVQRAGSGSARSFWYFQGKRLEAVDAMNDPKAFMIAKKLLENGVTFDPADIANPDSDLRALLKTA